MEILYTLLIILEWVIAYSLFNWYRQRKIVKTLTQDEFIANYRKVQLIDVREPNDFENGHILGARNIPMTQMKTRLVEIRPDKPVYLYAQSEIIMAELQPCYTKGLQELFHLKGGFKMWTRKIKAKK
ncbi:rhodanese-like domain-containing protein [[Brevibacterium] frigoritolerans]|uniref:Rhodanese-like domain-containing protein n=1 Tax=Peribacillus frigoritolerans TaxID=450367 RepID=A0A941FLI9_9BACI|nr:rhodanese-like domain-containing protein [Peribacillus frigoritolerans]